MHLNQYYTEKAFGDKLIQKLTLASPKLALDIGFGSGNLLRAAKRRWSDIDLIGIDIDYQNIQKEDVLKEINAVELNGFDPSLPEIIVKRFGKIDLLLSNPPYFAHEFDSTAKSILQSVGLLGSISTKLKKIPAELIFLAQNLRLLNENGELGIILPAGLISGERWKSVREHLFNNYLVNNVIQLPTNSFKHTDAQTFILTIKKHPSNPKQATSLSHTDKQLTLNININEAKVRADYDFYSNQIQSDLITNLNPGDFELYRGNRSYDQLKKMTDDFLHTTRMPKLNASVNLSDNPVDQCKNTYPGDIVLARVGRRCLGRALYITSGKIPISDCIIGIRPKNKKIGRAIYKKLNSDSCKNYFKHVALGVGAKYITYQTINDFLIGNFHEPT